MTDKLSAAQQAALLDAFEDGEGGHILWCDTNVQVAYALNRRRLVDDFFRLTDVGEATRHCLETKAIIQ